MDARLKAQHIYDVLRSTFIGEGATRMMDDVYGAEEYSGFIDVLHRTEKNYTFLGAGNFSTVWTDAEFDKENKVLKVGTHRDQDAAFLYLLWAMVPANQALPGVLKVYEVGKLGEDAYYAVIERLHGIDDDQYNAFYEDEEGDNRTPEYRTLEVIAEFFGGVAPTDVHDENIMQRADGSLVLSDPLGWSTGSTKQRVALEKRLMKKAA